MKATETTETVEATEISPKVKWGATITGVLTIIASAVAAIPQETWATLGEAGLPVGMAIGGIAYGVTAYLKRDPARETAVIRETAISAPMEEGGPEVLATAAEPVPSSPPLSAHSSESLGSVEPLEDGLPEDDTSSVPGEESDAQAVSGQDDSGSLEAFLRR